MNSIESYDYFDITIQPIGDLKVLWLRMCAYWASIRGKQVATVIFAVALSECVTQFLYVVDI